MLYIDLQLFYKIYQIYVYPILLWISITEVIVEILNKTGLVRKLK